MNKTVEHIKNLKSNICKLEKDFKRGVSDFDCFTLDLFYGGNKQVDIRRIEIGSIAQDKDSSKILYDLILKSLKQSLIFWENNAKEEIKELWESLK